MYRPYQGKYHQILWNMVWDQLWWFQSNVRISNIFPKFGNGYLEDENNKDHGEEVDVIEIGGAHSHGWPWFNVYEAITNCEPKGHLPPWSEAYFDYKIQWLKWFLNARRVVLYFVIMQHHYYKLLHQTFKTFVWHKPMNQRTWAWFLMKWRMAWGIQLINWTTNLKLC